MAINKIPTEACDIMQYYYRSAHDPLIHFTARLDCPVDISCLSMAADALIEQMPVLGCRFDEKNLKWIPADVAANDMIIEVQGESDDTVNRYLTTSVDIAKGPQLKLYVIHYAGYDVICTMINHMVCDGAGFKECLYRFSELYLQYKEQDVHKAPVLPTRSMEPLFSGMKSSEKRAMLFAKQENKEKKEKLKVLSPKLTGDKQNPFIVSHRISKEDFSVIKKAAKSHGATINDMILAAYIRALNRETGQAEIEIPCPVDLRKYCRGSIKVGLTNLTSIFDCRVTFSGQDTFETVLSAVSGQIRRQKESMDCLKYSLLLHTAYRVIPKKVLVRLFPKLFTIPVVSYTNLGILDFPAACKEHISDCFMTGAVKYVPYFQVAVSTFNGVCTLSCNLYGTEQDKLKIERFLENLSLDLKEFATM